MKYSRESWGWEFYEKHYTPKALQLSRTQCLEHRLGPFAKIAEAQLALLGTALLKAGAIIIITFFFCSLFIPTSLSSSQHQVPSLAMRASAMPGTPMGKVDAKAELASKMEMCLRQVLDGKAVFGAVSLASLV